MMLVALFMRAIVRILGALNALYLGLVGALAIAAPQVAASAFHAPGDIASTRALVRIVGGLLVANALGLATFARSPEKNPSLAPILLGGAAVNVLADVMIAASGDMAFADLAAGVVMQVILIAALAAHVGRKRSTVDGALAPAA